MEPQRWGLQGAELIAIKAELEPVLTELDVHGIKENIRRSHNRITDPTYQIVWWGEFQDLLTQNAELKEVFYQTEGLVLTISAAKLIEQLHRE